MLLRNPAVAPPDLLQFFLMPGSLIQVQDNNGNHHRLFLACSLSPLPVALLPSLARFSLSFSFLLPWFLLSLISVFPHFYFHFCFNIFLLLPLHPLLIQGQHRESTRSSTFLLSQARSTTCLVRLVTDFLPVVSWKHGHTSTDQTNQSPHSHQ